MAPKGVGVGVGVDVGIGIVAIVVSTLVEFMFGFRLRRIPKMNSDSLFIRF